MVASIVATPLLRELDSHSSAIRAYPHPKSLRVSPKAIAGAFKSFHSLLSLNTEYGGKEKKCKQLLQKPTEPLRVSVFFILRVSPKARAGAFKSFHSLLTPNTEYGGKEGKCKQLSQKPTEPLRVSVLFILRVSPKAIAGAFKSFHLLLTLNTETRR